MTWSIAFLCLASSLTASAVADAPAAPGGQRFDVLEYVIEGNTVLATPDVERAVYPYLGPGRGVEDVERARKALEDAYHGAGYGTVLVDLPEQRVNEGVVTLHVTEGTVSRLRVLGARYYDQSRIVKEVPSLAEGSVPYFPDVQRELGQLARAPGRSIEPVLRPGKAPGTTEVDLNVHDKSPWSGSVELNDHHSPDTTPLRLNTALRYANLFQREHTLGLQYETSPGEPRQVSAFSASYTVPLRQPDGFLVGYGVRSRSSTIASVGGLNIQGTGDIAGVRAIFQLPGSQRLSHNLTLGVDYKNVEEDLGGIKIPIRYWPLTLAYGGARNDDDGAWDFSGVVTASFRGFGNGDNAFLEKRFLARSNFATLRWDFSRSQALGHTFTLLARLYGQVADQPLISNEQFVAGGAATVRGYLESEQTGDNAYAGSLELRSRALTPGGGATPSLQPYAFVDGARLIIKEPLPGENERFTLSSAGLGVVLKPTVASTLNMFVAWPFHDHPQGSDQPFTRRMEPRLRVSAALEF